MSQGKALIIGAGPAGLTAALELQKHSPIQPVVLEASQEIGGLSRTVRYKNNRMDIGGHRFFSKSDVVTRWWLEQMPLGQGMLVRPRRSHIYSAQRFFEYPLAPTHDTVRKLGYARAAMVCLSYLHARIAPIRHEHSLEDFLINRFGRQLYRTFFKSYTEKVWGVCCDRISAAWGAQRIRGLSLSTALHHGMRAFMGRTDAANTETSLTRQFLYPELGPGQLWENVADKVVAAGGDLKKGETVTEIRTLNERVTSVVSVNEKGQRTEHVADYFFSTMPIRDLVQAMERGGDFIPPDIKAIADGLVYRDFITIGLLVDRLAITERDGSLLRDTWIYIQEPDVQIGRLQIFNNWSPHLVEPGKVWIGLEYFCNQSDDDPLWSMPDEALKRLGAKELHQIGILPEPSFLDAHVVRVPKAYPAYFGLYARFDELRAFTDRLTNLFLIGRNGMHRYNNQDHSMLTAMQAVQNVVRGVTSKENLWSINAEADHHETEDARTCGVNTETADRPLDQSVVVSH